jgi:hypothetical protein
MLVDPTHMSLSATSATSIPYLMCFSFSLSSIIWRVYVILWQMIVSYEVKIYLNYFQFKFVVILCNIF